MVKLISGMLVLVTMRMRDRSHITRDAADILVEMSFTAKSCALGCAPIQALGYQVLALDQANPELTGVDSQGALQVINNGR